MVDANGTLKLTLFSLSRLAADMPRAEESNSLIDFVESIRYFSPESLHAEARPSVWADMWAFGCIVFWVCSNFGLNLLFYILRLYAEFITRYTQNFRHIVRSVTRRKSKA